MAFKEIIKEFQDDLVRAADAFLTIGMRSFHHRRNSQAEMQVAMVNIAIACELLTKAFLARVGPALILADLTPADMVAFQAYSLFPEQQKSNAAVKLKFREFKSREFGDCLTMLYALKPDIKSTYASNLQRILRARNGGAHSAIASHEIHDVDRAAYVVLKIHENIGKDSRSRYETSKEDQKFLSKFDAARSERVRKALEDAQKKFHASNFKAIDTDADGWDEISIPCPICGSAALLAGETEHDGGQSGPEEYDEWLTFNATEFSCKGCGLKLEDEEELRLAGIEAEHDRSEQMEEWHHDMGNPWMDDDDEGR